MRALGRGGQRAPAYRARGRHPATAHLPHLLEAIRALVAGPSQTDPQLQSTRWYTWLTAAAVQRQLLAPKGSDPAPRPRGSTIGRKLQARGYQRRGQKTRPQKKIPATDALVAQVHATNTAAADPPARRLALDAPAAVLRGEFERGGTTRVPPAALDHDFAASGRVPPVGLVLPASAELFRYTVVGPLPSDGLVDLGQAGWAAQHARWPGLRCLVLKIDNGPEGPSGRPQWLARRVAFARRTGLRVRLA